MGIDEIITESRNLGMGLGPRLVHTSPPNCASYLIALILKTHTKNSSISYPEDTFSLASEFSYFFLKDHGWHCLSSSGNYAIVWHYST